MLGFVISIYLFITIVLCFVRVKAGIAMFLLYQILVPFVNIQLGSLSFGVNFINFAILLGLLFSYRNKIKQFSYKSLLPFLYLFGAQLLLIPFQTGMPMGEQLNNFRINIMLSLLLPFAMVNVMKFDKKAYNLFLFVLVIGILIATIYGLFLTLIPGINPWLMLVLPLGGAEFNDSYALADGEGRLFGRISSVFSHPMTFGLFLCFSFVFMVSNIKPKEKGVNVFYILMMVLIATAVFVCGIRTPIGTLVLAALFYLMLERKFKIFAYGALASVAVYAIISQIPNMATYVSSIFDSDSENVSGSSLDMRLNQLQGCFNAIRGHELTGLGYGWTTYYQSIRGDHPVILAFESLLYVVLCNSGYLGILIWGFMLFLYYRYVSKRFNHQGKSIMLTLMITYLTYSMITGEYGYMRYFLIFYVMVSAGLERNLELNKKLIHKLSKKILSKNKKRNKLQTIDK